MRRSYAHDAMVSMSLDADAGAPGAAVTVALCGHWEHEPPCPLAPHHTRADRVNDRVRLRILFATEPGLEVTVRERIDAALAAGRGVDPAGAATSWRLLASRPGEVLPDEAAHAARLVAG
jgi:hypothetical protein